MKNIYQPFAVNQGRVLYEKEKYVMYSFLYCKCGKSKLVCTISLQNYQFASKTYDNFVVYF